jgi:hypothetical protein
MIRASQNCNINGHQQTVIWHVDGVKSSQIYSKVNDNSYQWSQEKYGNPKIVSVKGARGKIHKFLGLRLDFSKPGTVITDMKNDIQEIIKELPDKYSII